MALKLSRSIDGLVAVVTGAVRGMVPRLQSCLRIKEPKLRH